MGSLSAATSAGGVVQGRQEYTPWGAQRGSGQITQTVLDFTGQRKDKDFSGLVFLNARYYDPVLGRFISGDSIVPGASGGVIGQDDGKLTPLTVDFHEVGFASAAGEENRLVLGKGFLDKETVHTGPSNPQALNRYSYVMNNPVEYTDPTGHLPPCYRSGCPGNAEVNFHQWVRGWIKDFAFQMAIDLFKIVPSGILAVEVR